MAEPSENRSARRRKSQHEMRALLEELARSEPWRPAGRRTPREGAAGASTVVCSFCGADGGRDHHDHCLWQRVVRWLEAHEHR
jgi:hypothetical protein